MKTALTVVVVLLGLAGSVQAQAPSTVQQQQALSTLAAVGQWVYTDGAQVNADAVEIYGWAFECSSASPGTVDALIDGQVVADTSMRRNARGDVWLWASSNGVCPSKNVPWYSGVDVLVDLAPYAPGAHTASLQIRNDAGVVTRTLKPIPFIK